MAAAEAAVVEVADEVVVAADAVTAEVVVSSMVLEESAELTRKGYGSGANSYGASNGGGGGYSSRW